MRALSFFFVVMVSFAAFAEQRQCGWSCRDGKWKQTNSCGQHCVPPGKDSKFVGKCSDEPDVRGTCLRDHKFADGTKSEASLANRIYDSVSSDDPHFPVLSPSLHFFEGQSARKSEYSLKEWRELYPQTPFGIVTKGLEVPFIRTVEGAVQMPLQPDDEYRETAIRTILRTCRNIVEMWERYACLAHEVQKYAGDVSNRSKFSNLYPVKFEDDEGKERTLDLPVCRNYATFMAEVCKREFGATLNCVADYDFSRFHAWVTLRVDQREGSYLYYHDVMNDPFAPDLVAVNRRAVELNGLPLEGECCCFLPGTASYSRARRDGAGCRNRCGTLRGTSFPMNRCPRRE